MEWQLLIPKVDNIKNTIMRRRIQSPAVQVNFVFPFDREDRTEEQEKAECLQLMPILLKLDHKNANFN